MKIVDAIETLAVRRGRRHHSARRRRHEPHCATRASSWRSATSRMSTTCSCPGCCTARSTAGARGADVVRIDVRAAAARAGCGARAHRRRRAGLTPRRSSSTRTGRSSSPRGTHVLPRRRPRDGRGRRPRGRTVWPAQPVEVEYPGRSPRSSTRLAAVEPDVTTQCGASRATRCRAPPTCVVRVDDGPRDERARGARGVPDAADRARVPGARVDRGCPRRSCLTAPRASTSGLGVKELRDDRDQIAVGARHRRRASHGRARRRTAERSAARRTWPTRPRPRWPRGSSIVP